MELKSFRPQVFTVIVALALIGAYGIYVDITELAVGCMTSLATIAGAIIALEKKPL